MEIHSPTFVDSSPPSNDSSAGRKLRGYSDAQLLALSKGLNSSLR